MKHYIGLDISKESTNICMMDENNQVIKEAKVATDPDTIAFTIKKFGDYEIEIVGLETGSWSRWLEEELCNRDLPTLTLDAREVSTFINLKPNKTDRNDAKTIAKFLCGGTFSVINNKSKEAVAIGMLLKSRNLLVRQRVDTQSTIRGLLKPLGVFLKIHQGETFIDAVMKALKTGFPEEIVFSIKNMLESLRFLQKKLKMFDAELEKVANKKPVIKQLMTVPGVGLITACCFVSEIDDPSRFSNPKQIGAYFGLTPRQYSSGKIEKQGRISKQGSSMMRTLLYESGLVILSRVKKWSKLKAWGKKIQKNHNSKVAAVAVGRKLSTILYIMMLTGEDFKFTDKIIA